MSPAEPYQQGGQEDQGYRRRVQDELEDAATAWAALHPGGELTVADVVAAARDALATFGRQAV